MVYEDYTLEIRISKNKAHNRSISLDFYKLEKDYKYSIGEAVELKKQYGSKFDIGEYSLVQYVSGEFVDILDEHVHYHDRYRKTRKKGPGGVQRVKAKHLMPLVKRKMIDTLVRLSFVKPEDAQIHDTKNRREHYRRDLYLDYDDNWGSTLRCF